MRRKRNVKKMSPQKEVLPHTFLGVLEVIGDNFLIGLKLLEP